MSSSSSTVTNQGGGGPKYLYGPPPPADAMIVYCKEMGIESPHHIEYALCHPKRHCLARPANQKQTWALSNKSDWYIIEDGAVVLLLIPFKKNPTEVCCVAHTGKRYVIGKISIAECVDEPKENIPSCLLAFETNPFSAMGLETNPIAYTENDERKFTHSFERRPLIKDKTWWVGYVQENSETIPVTMILEVVEGGRVEGLLGWPSLENSELALVGTIDRDLLRFDEDSIIKGHALVVSGAKYTCTINPDGTKLYGHWILQDGKEERTGTFTAHLTCK